MGMHSKYQLRLQVLYLYFCHIKRLYYLSRSKEKDLEFQGVYIYIYICGRRRLQYNNIPTISD